MRFGLLSLLMLVFALIGTVVFAIGLLALVGSYNADAALTSWFGAYAGLVLIVSSAVCFIVAVLAYIANTLADAVQPQTRGSWKHLAPPGTPWYQDGIPAGDHR